MTQRSLSFGAVAADYETYRPGYPDELVREVLEYADRPVRTALEIGAGTGKATRVFTRHGVAVTASDPDPQMLAELRRHLADGVTTLVGAFEELPLSSRYDLVFAAASLHWTRPEGRWPRVAALLEPGGTFACFGGQRELAEPAVAQRVDAVRRRYLEDDDVPSPDGTPPESPLQWPGTELVASGLFEDVRQTRFEQRVGMPAAGYVGHLSTVSAYLQLPEPVRRQALTEILDVLPDEVEMVGDITLHLARLS